MTVYKRFANIQCPSCGYKEDNKFIDLSEYARGTMITFCKHCKTQIDAKIFSREAIIRNNTIREELHKIAQETIQESTDGDLIIDKEYHIRVIDLFLELFANAEKELNDELLSSRPLDNERIYTYPEMIARVQVELGKISGKLINQRL